MVFFLFVDPAGLPLTATDNFIKMSISTFPKTKTIHTSMYSRKLTLMNFDVSTEPIKKSVFL